MFSAGQTQNVGTRPGACLMLPFTDRGGEHDMRDGVADQRDCTTMRVAPSGAGEEANVQGAVNDGSTPDQPAANLAAITSLACASSPDEERAQCIQNIADVYTANLERVPENLRPVFEGFAQVIANTIFRVCPADTSNPLCSNGEINLWGGTYTFADFLVRLADLFTLTADANPCADFHCLTGIELSRFNEEQSSAYTSMRAQCNCDGTPVMQTGPLGDGTDNALENGLPYCADLSATAVQIGTPCDPESDCRPELSTDQLQYELSEIRSAYPDDPQTQQNESDVAVNNYLSRSVCQEEPLENNNVDDATGVNCDTLTDVNWSRNAENCMNCGRTECD